MPISELKVFNGTVPYYRLFPETDHRLLNSEKAIAKIKRVFARVPYNFNLYLMLDNQESYKTYDSNESIIGSMNTDDHISMIYTHDYTGNYHPMTAWILAHRMIHAIHNTNIMEPVIFEEIHKIFNYIKNPSIPEVVLCNDYLRRTGYNPRSYDTDGDADRHITKFSNIILTMKSARDNNIKNSLDIGAEIFAQYVITGKVRLNRFVQWDTNIVKQYNEWDKSVYATPLTPIKNHQYIRSDFNQLEIDTIIGEAEEKMNLICEKQISLLIGKIIQF